MIERLIIKDGENSTRELKDYADNERGTLIEWKIQTGLHTFSLEHSRFIAALSPSKRQILVMHQGANKTIDRLKILNSDASLRFDLLPPSPLSRQFVEYRDKVGDDEATSSLRFIQFGDRISKTVITVWVGFGFDWFEARELDIMKGDLVRH